MKKILFITSFPPPYHGGNVDNENIFTFWDSIDSCLIPFKILKYRHIGIIKIGKLTGLNIINGIMDVIKLSFHFLLYYRSYDIILMNLAQGTWGFIRDSFFILICSMCNKRIICRFPGGDFIKFYQASRFKPFIKAILNKVAKIITEGERINVQFVAINKSINVQSAHIGIPDCNKNSIKRNSSQFEILYICNHRKEKGFWDVLLSIKPIIKENNQITFNFVGELRLTESEKKFVADYISQENLNNHIRFPGILKGEDKWEVYRNASVQILPSYSEGLPTSIIEGLSFGLPIIATRVGVIPEVIKQEINGYLIDPGDKEALQKNILMLSRNPSLINQITATNRHLFLSEYTIEKFIFRLEQAILME